VKLAVQKASALLKCLTLAKLIQLSKSFTVLTTVGARLLLTKLVQWSHALVDSAAAAVVVDAAAIVVETAVDAVDSAAVAETVVAIAVETVGSTCFLKRKQILGELRFPLFYAKSLNAMLPFNLLSDLIYFFPFTTS
jgi:hypothetical protein